ncbi:unnamed protein product [[Candida] boidinii]|nr:unnamed protein product [[Candida] boidinii]
MSLLSPLNTEEGEEESTEVSTSYEYQTVTYTSGGSTLETVTSVPATVAPATETPGEGASTLEGAANKVGVAGSLMAVIFGAILMI